MNKIINFHDVRDADWFEKVILLLVRKYKIITANDLYDYYYHSRKLRNSCLITVDDGNVSSYDVIYPILKKYDVPAIFFVSPKIALGVGERKNFWFQEVSDYNQSQMWKDPSVFSIQEIWERIGRYQSENLVQPKKPCNMTATQIVQIDKEGLVEIGAHTMSHPFLSKETDKDAYMQITESIIRLESLLGHSILTFAYPNGREKIDFDEREMRIMADTTVKLAFSTGARNFTRNDNVFSIPRYGLSRGSMGFVRIKLALGRYYPVVKSICDKLK